VAEALITPTRIYVRAGLAAMKHDGLRGFAHITGGGLTENVPRVLPETLAARIDPAAWTRPPVFDWLATTGGIEEAEMRRAFNCGIGMVVVVDPAAVDDVRMTLEGEGETVFEIGEVRPRDGASVVYGTA
jgi:phosphoribosylformylglycinamidine cyclo-ligase